MGQSLTGGEALTYIGVHMHEQYHRFQKYPVTSYEFQLSSQENTPKQRFYTVSHQIWISMFPECETRF